MKRSLILFLTLTLAVVAAHADDMLEDRGSFRPTFFAELQDIELQGDRAYVFGVGGLFIVNIADPDDPTFLGRYAPADDRADRFYRGSISGGYAYGGARESGLVVVDIVPEITPVFVQRFEGPGLSYEGSTVEGGFLYACRHDDGLEIFSLADPAAPVSLSEFTGLTNAWDVVVRDGLAYVADGIGGLTIVDVSDPSAPALTANVSSAGAVSDVMLHGDVAVVASGSVGLELFDVSDPANPLLLSVYNTSGLAATIDVDGDLVFVADWDDVEVVDISVPTAPVAAGNENTPVRAMGLAAAAGKIYVADWARFRIYDYGFTSRGDIEIPKWFEFPPIPPGGTVDTTFTVGNTGGGVLTVTDIQIFNDDFEFTPPLSFTVPPGGTVEVPFSYHNDAFGEDITFMRVDSDDTDEGESTLPVIGEPDPSELDLGEPAPLFVLTDLDGVVHDLEQYQGRVVVLAFFANW